MTTLPRSLRPVPTASMSAVTFHSRRSTMNMRSVTRASSPFAPCTASVTMAMGQACIFALPSKRPRSNLCTVKG